MIDPEALSAELYDANRWAEENPDAWLSLMLDLDNADDFQPQAV